MFRSSFVSRRVRAFSLIETLIVVALLAILAAIALPNLTPMLKNEGLRASGAAVYGFIAQARLTAMTERRCVRVRIDSATGPAVLVAERLNAYDCENPSGPLIVASAPLWMEIGRQRLEQESLALAFNPAPSETPGELRFRPSGRLFSNDDDLSDDDGVIQVTQPALATLNTVKVLVDAAGPVCALPQGQNPPGSGNNLECP